MPAENYVYKKEMHACIISKSMQNMEIMQTWFGSAIPVIAILRMRFEDVSTEVIHISKG